MPFIERRKAILRFISGIRRPCWVLYKSVILGLMLGIYDHLWLDMGYRKAIPGLILGIGLPSSTLYWTQDGRPGLYIWRMISILVQMPRIGFSNWVLYQIQNVQIRWVLYQIQNGNLIDCIGYEDHHQSYIGHRKSFISGI